MRHRLAQLLVALFFTALAHTDFLLASSSLPVSEPHIQSAPPNLQIDLQLPLPNRQIELQIVPQAGLQSPDPQIELFQNSVAKPRIEVPAQASELVELPDAAVAAWSDQILQGDDLTRCIRGSEAGNAIERWLDCLESLENRPPALAAQNSGPPLFPSLKPLASSRPSAHESMAAQLEAPRSDAEVMSPKSRMRVFDPLSGAPSRGANPDSPHEAGFARTAASGSNGDANPTMRSDGVEHSDASSMAVEDPRPDADARASKADGFTASPGRAAALSRDSSGSEVTEDVELSPGRGLQGRDQFGRGGGGRDARGPGFDSDTGSESSCACTDSQTRQSSVYNEDTRKGVEVSMDAATSNKMQNLMDAFKLAACLGAAATLVWRKKGKIGAQESLFSEQIEDHPRPSSATGFSVAEGRSSSNTDVAYPNAKAGSLPAPLGMAIATVMAEVMQQERSQEEPLSADELSKLLEAAMTETLSPVMGGECPGFVDQFKLSFRSTYRLIGTVRQASAKKPARPSFREKSQRYPARQADGRRFRRIDDEEDYSVGVSNLPGGARFDSGAASGIRAARYEGMDVRADLAEQFSKLSFSERKPKKESENGSMDMVPPKGGARSTDGGESSHVDQGPLAESGDVRSSARPNGLLEKSREERSHGARFLDGRWDEGTGLSFSRGDSDLNESETQSNPSQSASQRIHVRGSSQESHDVLDLAMQPFCSVPPPSQVAAASGEEEMMLSGLSHYGGARLQQEMIHVMKESNHLKYVELQCKMRGLTMKKANLHLTAENNDLMRENVGLGREKAEWREAEFQDRKLATAYADFTRTCADELVAGLCVMLCALFFGGWKYSYARLVAVVSSCQPSFHEPSNSMIPGVNRVVNSLNHLTSLLHMFFCEVTVASRMLLGLGIISIIAASLLRKSVTSSSQAMPATILVIVLGGLCGLAGKLAVDSMGGSGYHWLLMWEALCFVHMSATCFTSFVYWIVNGSPPSTTTSAGKQRRRHLVSPWLRRLVFHVTIVLVLPVLAGLLPFAPVREVGRALGSTFWSLVFLPVGSYIRDRFQFSLL